MHRFVIFEFWVISGSGPFWWVKGPWGKKKIAPRHKNLDATGGGDCGFDNAVSLDGALPPG